MTSVSKQHRAPHGVLAAMFGGEPQALPVSYTFFQGREATKRRAVTTALLLLRRALLARR
jgi:hypothetical protein